MSETSEPVAASTPGLQKDWGLLRDIPFTIRVEIGRTRMTVREVHGVSGMARQAVSDVSPEPMVRIEVGVNDHFVEAAIAAIEQSGGDRGRIFTWELDEVVRIRTGETGPEAI